MNAELGRFWKYLCHGSHQCKMMKYAETALWQSTLRQFRVLFVQLRQIWLFLPDRILFYFWAYFYIILKTSSYLTLFKSMFLFCSLWIYQKSRISHVFRMCGKGALAWKWVFNPLTLLATNCLSVIDHFVGLALKGLIAHVVRVTILWSFAWFISTMANACIFTLYRIRFRKNLNYILATGNKRRWLSTQS